MHSLTALANLLYPPICVLCRTDLRASTGTRRGYDCLLCQECRARMPRCGPPVCTSCGVELPGAFDALATCSSCRRHPKAFEAARAPWRYDGIAQAALQQFKYRRRHRVGDWLSETMSSAARSSLPMDSIDVVMPVPSHWLAGRLRGFDAPDHLARRVSRLLEKPYLPRALRRSRWTTTQTRLSWAKRFRNVRAAFTARPRLVRDRIILLVDDVLTSGATADACARALRQAGAVRVFVLTAARTPLA